MLTLLKKHKTAILLFLSIMFLLFYWKSNEYKLTAGYNRVPYVRDILDERINVMAGITFLRTGIATGWSNFDYYGSTSEKNYHPHLNFDGLHITSGDQKPSLSNVKFFNYPVTYMANVDLPTIGTDTIIFVQPFFDHSPFGGMIYSLGVSKINSIEKLDASEYRAIATKYIFILNGILLFLAAYVLYKNWLTSLAAYFIYMTSPTYVFSSRFALLENVIIPLTLIMLILMGLYKKHINNNKISLMLLVSSGITAGMAILTKELGISIFILGLVLIISYGQWKKRLIYYLIPALSVGSLFYFYSLLISPSLTFNVLFHQVGRGFFGPLNFLYAVKQMQFHNFPLDGFWIFGFIALLCIFKLKGKNLELSLGFLISAFVFLLFGGLNYPWYSLPFVPFFVLASAVFITEVIQSPTLKNIFLFYVFPFSSSFYWGYVVHRPEANISFLNRMFLLVFVCLSLMVYFFKKKPFLVLWGIFIILIGIQMVQWNVQSIEFITEHWGQLPDKFFAL